MTISLPVPHLGIGDDVSNYDGLIRALVRALQDSTLENEAPRYIYLAERELRRVLWCIDAEEVAPLTAAASVALPLDYKAIKSLYLVDTDRVVLTQLSHDDFSKKWASPNTGRPVNFAVTNGSILLGPSPDSAYSLSLTYTKGLPSLSADLTTNWLLEEHADVYFYSALAHAEVDGWNDERAANIRPFVEGLISQVNQADARKRRGDFVGAVAGCYF